MGLLSLLPFLNAFSVVRPTSMAAVKQLEESIAAGTIGGRRRVVPGLEGKRL